MSISSKLIERDRQLLIAREWERRSFGIYFQSIIHITFSSSPFRPMKIWKAKTVAWPCCRKAWIHKYLKWWLAFFSIETYVRRIMQVICCHRHLCRKESTLDMLILTNEHAFFFFEANPWQGFVVIQSIILIEEHFTAQWWCHGILFHVINRRNDFVFLNNLWKWKTFEMILYNTKKKKKKKQINEQKTSVVVHLCKTLPERHNKKNCWN